MFGLIGTIIIGFIVGLIARALHPGNDKLGFFLTIILGVAGSFLARYLGQAIGWYREDESAGFIASTVGAIVLLAIYSMYKRSKAKA